MSTHTAISYHVVFSTKDRIPVLTRDRREDLFRYIWGIIRKRHGHLYRINGVEDHLHILTSLHPTVCLADFVKEIKDGFRALDQGEGSFQEVLPLAGRIRSVHVFPSARLPG